MGDLARWNQRHREETPNTTPTPLVTVTAELLTPGTALDLACGSGRNALWLADHGWQVTAIDGSDAAIELVRRHAHPAIATVIANLETGDYTIADSAWDLIVIAYYLQRELFDKAKAGLKPGGILIGIAHLTNPGEEPTAHRLIPGELRAHFANWEILHHREGPPANSTNPRPLAEIVVRKPSTNTHSETSAPDRTA